MDNAALFFETMDIWVLSDGKPGHLNQSLGVAEALAIDSAQIKVIELKKRRFGAFLSLFWPPLKVTNLPQGPWPHVVIATGSLTVPVSKWVKMQSPRTVTVQMMAPLNRFGLKFKPGGFLDHVFNHENLNFFDVVASPVHEGKPENKSTVLTLGAPNRITPLKLKEAQMKWGKIFSSFKDKKIAVLVGGNNKRFLFDEKKVQDLADDLTALTNQQATSFLMTTSRRTGKMQENLLKKAFVDDHYIWNGKGDNPYMGILACADAIVVTPDSVSMVSEAASTGKPVFIWGLDDDMTLLKMGKFNIFYQALYKNGFIKPFKEALKVKAYQIHPALDDTSKVAGAVRAHIVKRLNHS
jgi:mitochondrial fission protein ELM1